MEPGQYVHYYYAAHNGAHAPPPGVSSFQHEQPFMTPVVDHRDPNWFPPPQVPATYAPGPSENYRSASTCGIKEQKRRQACEKCRQRKQRCGGGQPCWFCKENSSSCEYRDTPLTRIDKDMETLHDCMKRNVEGMLRMTSLMETLNTRLGRIEQPYTRAAVSATVLGDEGSKQMPELDDHRTAPHKLILLWPSVQPLLKDAGVDISNSYVMEAEDRGVLRFWTRGEGMDEYDGTQPGGASSPARSEDSCDGNIPSSPHGVWGTGFPQTPMSETSRSSEPHMKGGLKTDGSLDLDVNTINTLYESYMKNMHHMHPFLDKQWLRNLFDSFVKRYSTSPPVLHQTLAVNYSSYSVRPSKRQRSNAWGVPSCYPHEQTLLRRDATERSPGNGIVWLVLALGKVCMETDPLEGPVPDGSASTNATTSHNLTGNSGLSSSWPVLMMIENNEMPPKPTSGAQPKSPGMDSYMRSNMHSRRASIDSSSGPRPRNMDRVAGLAYFAKACEIMGDQNDGNDLVHAQMFLLAGLYEGQLARVKESMSYFCQAGRAIRVLLDRYKLYAHGYGLAHGDVRKRHENEKARIKDKRHNLIVLASWACLHLESDILADMRLPSSGIGTLEHMLLYPHKMPDDDSESYDGLDLDNQSNDSESSILIFYTAQMFLRKRLSRVHQEMYGEACLDQPLNEVKEMLTEHERILQQYNCCSWCCQVGCWDSSERKSLRKFT